MSYGSFSHRRKRGCSYWGCLRRRHNFGLHSVFGYADGKYPNTRVLSAFPCGCHKVLLCTCLQCSSCRYLPREGDHQIEMPERRMLASSPERVTTLFNRCDRGRSRWDSSRDCAPRSVSSSAGPTDCVTRSLCGSRSWLACCRSCEHIRIHPHDYAKSRNYSLSFTETDSCASASTSSKTT